MSKDKNKNKFRKHKLRIYKDKKGKYIVYKNKKFYLKQNNEDQ
jgi:hypothetical protein